MKDLELLAPARNADIGIAAIDCGADAVYIAGPSLGARAAAGNAVADIARLTAHAHRFGARVFITVNTIIYEDELSGAKALVRELIEAGADALIVQDLALVTIMDELEAEGVRRIPLHASTQCANRSPETSRFLEGLGFSRLILEREMSLEQVREIRESVDTELEFFVHGALCVCYSGQCYLSEMIAGRSANRGACIQACRSRYDLVDATGKVLVRDKALLSLKDYNLSERLEELADAGVSSFKIEGRLKNESYVRNVVRQYSEKLDELVAKRPLEYRRASFGHTVKCFVPAPEKTFNRGYTELYIDGRRGQWSSMDAPKGMGEKIGKVSAINPAGTRITVDTRAALANGDGFAFVPRSGDPVGFRADRAEGNRIETRSVPGLSVGAVLYRNLDTAFEKEIARNPGTRQIRVSLQLEASLERLKLSAVSEDGRKVTVEYPLEAEAALNETRMREIIRTQLSKSTLHYEFSLEGEDYDAVPMVSAAFLNAARREIAEKMDIEPCRTRPLSEGKKGIHKLKAEERLSCKANVANTISERIYIEAGAKTVEPAYEISHSKGTELMRSRYCIRHELGICLKTCQKSQAGPLFLLNNGRRLSLGFDCANCEMTVREDE